MKGIILILTATILLTFKGIFAKLAYLEGATVDAVLLLRYTICLPFLWLSLLIYKNHNIRQYFNYRDLRFILLLSFLGYYLATKGDYISIKLIGAGISRMILYSFPVFVLLTNIILERKAPTIGQIAITLILQIGLVTVLSGGDFSLLQINLEGGLFALMAALTYGLHLAFLGHYGKHISSHAYTLFLISFATIFMLIDFTTTNHLEELLLTPKAYLWITLMAIFSTALPFFMMAEGVKRIGSNDAALLSSFGPVLGLVLAYFIVDERYNFTQILGSAIIIVSIYFLCRQISRRQTQTLD